MLNGFNELFTTIKLFRHKLRLDRQGVRNLFVYLQEINF